MTQFAELKEARRQLLAVHTYLAAVPATLCDAETQRALVAGLASLDRQMDRLDDAMVADIRLQTFIKSLPPADPFDTEELLANHLTCFVSIES